MEWLMAGILFVIIVIVMVRLLKPKDTKVNEELNEYEIQQTQLKIKRMEENRVKQKSIQELLTLSTEPLWLDNGFFVELSGDYIHGFGYDRLTMYKDDIKIDMSLGEFCIKSEESGIVNFEGYDWILETLVDESNKVEEEYNKVMSHPLIKGGK